MDQKSFDLNSLTRYFKFPIISAPTTAAATSNFANLTSNTASIPSRTQQTYPAKGSNKFELNPKPIQPIIKFPKTKRRFIQSWYEKYSWVEYSVSLDRAFCYNCRIYDTRSGNTEDTYIKDGFQDWEHATATI